MQEEKNESAVEPNPIDAHFAGAKSQFEKAVAVPEKPEDKLGLVPVKLKGSEAQRIEAKSGDFRLKRGMVLEIMGTGYRVTHVNHKGKVQMSMVKRGEVAR